MAATASYVARKTVSGTATTVAVKFGGTFAVASEAVYSTSGGTTTTSYVWRCAELGGYVIDAKTAANAAPTALGQTSTITTGAIIYSDTAKQTSTGIVVTSHNLCEITVNKSGNGTVTLSNSDNTVFEGKYVDSGFGVTIAVAASSGSAISVFKVAGTTVSGSSTVYTPTSDFTVEARFVLSSYAIATPTVSPSGYGTVTADKSGQVSAGTVVTYTCTAASGKRFAYVEINGSRYATATTAYTVTASPTDGTIECCAHFVSDTQVENTLTVGSGGTVAVTDSSGSAVTVTGGKFKGYVGASYTVTATPSSGYRTYGIYIGTRKVSSSNSYTFTQYEMANAFSVLFEAGTSGVSLYCGSSSSSTDSTWNGCSCAKTVSGNNYTFTPSAASGYTFESLYIEDLDDSGKGKVIVAVVGQTAYPTTIDFNAKVVAIFRNANEPSDPNPEDQGHASALCAATVKLWEGAVTRMSATWASRRSVFVKPVSLAGARVYANGYTATSPVLRVRQYRSPQATDAAVGRVDVVVKSEGAFRLGARRPEKYVEVEVSGSTEVLEVSVGTSMEGLCQQAT